MKDLFKTNQKKRLMIACIVPAICLVLTSTTVNAGKLRSSIIATSNDLRAVSKETREVAEEFSGLIANAFQLLQMNAGGVDETYLYITQKLKAKDQKYSDNLNKTISDFSDKNVEAFLKGIDDGRKQAIKFSKEWKDVGDELKKKLDELDD